MGLDIVEFVMDVEESFGISIPDDVAERFTTPRKLIDYILDRVPRSSESRWAIAIGAGLVFIVAAG